MIRARTSLIFLLGVVALFSVGASAAPPPVRAKALSPGTKASAVLRAKTARPRSLARTGGPSTQAADVVALDQGQNWVLITVPGSGTTLDNGGDGDPIEMPPVGGGAQPPVGPPLPVGGNSVSFIPPPIPPPPGPGVDPGTDDLNVYIIHGDLGVSESTLPATIKDDLAGGSTTQGVVSIDDGGDSLYIVRQDIADGIAASEAAGELTPEIAAIAEPLDDDGEMELSPIVASSSSCAMTEKAIRKVFNLGGHSFGKSYPLGDGFTGSFAVSGNLEGAATAELNLYVKRKKVLFWCVPYGVKFKNVHIFGDATANAGVTVAGTIAYKHSFGPVEIIKPELFSILFFVGPVPVIVGFNLPISAGLDVDADLTGSITYNGSHIFNGGFDWVCTLDDCQGSGDFDGNAGDTTQTVTGGVSGHLKPDAYVNVGFRAYLYTEWVAYLQAGLRPYILGDLWGYTGNNCGDADGDGTFESVSALTFDLDRRIDLTGEASVLGLDPWHHTLRKGSVSHIGFYDLIGSSVMQPELHGPASAKAGIASEYLVKIRPCWPYDKNIIYGLNWGDGSAVEEIESSPVAYAHAFHTWTAAGTPTVTATSLRDKHGRALNQSTSRNVPVCSTLAISGQPLPVTIDSGTSATLAVTSTGTAFQWYQGNSGDTSAPVAGGTGSSVAVAPTATTSYWVRVTNACSDTLNSNAAVVTVNLGCHVDGTPCGGDGNHTCQAGQCVCSSCASGVCCGATGNPFCDGQAHPDPNTGYTGTCASALPSCSAANDYNGNNLIFHAGDILACVKFNGTYQWTLSRPSPRCQEVSAVCGFECSTHYANGAGFMCDQGGTWSQTTLSYCNNGTIPAGFSCQTCPAVTSQPQSTTILQGQSATLTVAMSGTAPTYQWYRGNSGDTSNPVTGGTGTSVVVTPSSTTNYWVRASNTCGQTNSQAATVTVNVPPSITSQPQPATINPGVTATLSVTASGTSLFYQWYQGTAPNKSQPVAGGSAATIFVSPASTTSYWVEIWNSVGTLDSSTATVTVGCGPDGAACGGDGHHTCQAGACACTDCNSSACCGATGNTRCDGQAHSDPNTGYAGACSSALPSCTAANDFNGTNAIFHGGDILACVKYNGIYQWEPRRPSPRCQEASPVCGFECSTHYANGAGFVCDQSGNWNQNPPLSYCNNGTIPNGYSCQICPLVTSQPQSTTIQQGDSATLTFAVSGSSPTYQWYQGNSGDTSSPVAGGTGTSIAVTPSSTTSYWVRASNTCGQTNSQTATVTVNVPCVPPSISSQPQSVTINPGATATLSVAASGSSLSYQWYQGAAGNTSQPVGSGATLFVSAASTTSYWVAVYNNCGSLASSTATVTLGCGPDGASCGGDGHHTCQAGACSCTDCNSSVCCGAAGNSACNGQQHFDANTGYTGVCQATLAACSAANDFDGTNNVFHNGDIVACVKHSGVYGWVPRRPSPRCQEVSPVCDYLCANHFIGGAGFMCDQNGNWNTSLPLANCYGGTIPSSYLCP
jgi:hypothetical protein